MAEVAHYLGVSPNNLKRLHLEGKGPVPTTASGGRRFYTAEQMQELRLFLDRTGKAEAKKYVPHRKPGDKLQVIAVVNFKGGSGKTTTAAHLAQHLALTGHRVLAVDLDPQASLSALHGFQPELDRNPRSMTRSAMTTSARRSARSSCPPISRPRHHPGQSGTAGI